MALPSNIESVVNQGLMAAGIRRRIADIYEGSAAAIVAIELFGQARDELIRITDWSFSRRVAALTLLKGPPPDGGFSPAVPWSASYPYPGFLYEYAYPSDCLDLRAIIAPPGLMPDLDPLPAVFRIDNDPTPNVSQGVQATGTIHFLTNPSNGATITLNGILIAFVTGSPVGSQVQIQANCGATVIQLVTAFLQTSQDPALTVATYGVTNGVSPPNDAYLDVTYKTYGTAGNAYGLAASAATPSGSHLAGGVDGPIYSGPAQKVILCNTTNALGVYRARVTDPTTWEPGFVASLVAALGKKFAAAFDEDLNLIRQDGAEGVATTRAAADIRG